MDEKRKSKRAKLVEDSLWECSVCTYRNSPDAFKCEMCDVRKGTSTRKPNPQVVAQQIASVSVVTKKEKPPSAPKPKTSSESQKTDDVTKIKKKAKSSTSGSSSRLSGSSIEVTVGNVSVIITDCPPPGKSRKNSVSENALSCKGSPSYVASCSSDADNSLDGSSSANKSFASTLSSPPPD